MFKHLIFSISSSLPSKLRNSSLSTPNRYDSFVHLILWSVSAIVRFPFHCTPPSAQPCALCSSFRDCSILTHTVFSLDERVVFSLHRPIYDFSTRFLALGLLSSLVSLRVFHSCSPHLPLPSLAPVFPPSLSFVLSLSLSLSPSLPSPKLALVGVSIFLSFGGLRIWLTDSCWETRILADPIRQTPRSHHRQYRLHLYFIEFSLQFPCSLLWFFTFCASLTRFLTIFLVNYEEFSIINRRILEFLRSQFLMFADLITSPRSLPVFSHFKIPSADNPLIDFFLARFHKIFRKFRIFRSFESRLAHFIRKLRVDRNA